MDPWTIFTVRHPHKQNRNFQMRRLEINVAFIDLVDFCRIWKHTTPEIFLVLIPLMMSSGPVIIIPVYYLLLPNSPQFCFSLLPSERQSPPMLLILVLLESWAILNWYSLSYHVTFLTAMLLHRSIDVWKEGLEILK